MKKLLFILFSFFIQFGFAQNWELFPEKQFSNFETDTYYDTTLEMTFADTITLSGDASTTYFKYESTMSGLNDCLDELSDYIQNGLLPVSQSSVLPHCDSIVEINDTSWLYGSNFIDKFPFLTKAALNQKWYPLPDYSDLYLKCIFSGTGDVLGITDSIKKYKFYKDADVSPLTDFTIILSKNYGLIDFLDFNDVCYNPDTDYPEFHHMIGFKNDLMNIGYQLPAFIDYFPVDAGDIRIWDQYVYNPDPFNFDDYHIYYKDSTTAKIVYTDSIYYEYDLWKKDTNGVISSYPNQKITFTKTGFEPLFNTIPGWIGLTNNFYCFDESNSISIWKHSQTNLLIEDDTTITHFYSAGEYYLDTSDCFVFNTADYFAGFSVSDKFGITSYNGIQLIGSILNGTDAGITDFNSVSIIDLKKYEVHIYPNPANNFIQIDIPTNKSFLYSIFSFEGKLISTSELTANQINIENLIPGIYILEIKNENEILRGKFIKQ